MKIYKLTFDHSLNWCVFPSEELLFEDLKYMEPGTTATIDVLEMTEEEFNNLPEFEGW